MCIGLNIQGGEMPPIYKGEIMEVKEFTPKIPPSPLYCPICNQKAEVLSSEIEETDNILTIQKGCKTCGAQWSVDYNIIPKKIWNLETRVIYKDIPLN